MSIFLNQSPLILLTDSGEISASLAKILSASDTTAGGSESLKSLAVFNRRALTFFGLVPDSATPLPEFWESYPQADYLAEELREHLEVNYSTHDNWSLVEPHTYRLVPLYLKVFDRLGLLPTFALVAEEPSDRHHVKWLRFTLTALDAIKGRPFIAITTTRGEDPKAILGRLTAKQSLDEFANGALQQHFDTSESPDLCSQIWKFFLNPQLDHSQLEPILEQFQSLREIFAPQPLLGTRIGFAWNQGGLTRSVQEPILPSGNWQTVRVMLNALPQTLVNGLLYNKPCRVWIRRAHFKVRDQEFPVKFTSGPGSSLSVYQGMIRLDGAYESQQLSLVTPSEPGPYELEMDLLLESGLAISVESTVRIASRLHECAAKISAINQRIKGRG